MVSVPRWLFVFLIPVLFLGGCVSSIPPVWALLERGWIRQVRESDKPAFPVLVRGADGVFASVRLGEIPSDSVIVTSGLDDFAINRDLNANINSKSERKFFQILDRTADAVRVTLEMPTTRDSKRQGWYEIRDGQVFPQKVMSYGPGFAFVVIPFTTLCGLALVAVFRKFVRPRRRG